GGPHVVPPYERDRDRSDENPAWSELESASLYFRTSSGNGSTPRPIRSQPRPRVRPWKMFPAWTISVNRSLRSISFAFRTFWLRLVRLISRHLFIKIVFVERSYRHRQHNGSCSCRVHRINNVRGHEDEQLVISFVY